MIEAGRAARTCGSDLFINVYSQPRNGPIANRDRSENDQILAQFSGINVWTSSSLAKLDLGLAGRSVVW